MFLFPGGVLFKNIKVKNAIVNFVESQGGYDKDKQIYLLSTSDGRRIGEDSIQKFIRSRTLNEISESDINKIQVTRINNVQDFGALKRMSDNRGTSIQNLITEYNLNFPVNS